MQLRTSLDIDEKAKKADGKEHARFVFTLDEKYLKRFSYKAKDAVEKLTTLGIMVRLLFYLLYLSHPLTGICFFFFFQSHFHSLFSTLA